MDSNLDGNLVEARKQLLACERLFYLGLTILKDNRILARTLGELARAAMNTIKAYLRYESEQRNPLFGSSWNSLKYFFKKVAPKYISSEDVNSLVKLLSIARIHKDSSMEFVRNERLVMHFNGKYEIVAKENVLEYLKVVKKLIRAFPIKKA